jgi:hypothetical protein
MNLLENIKSAYNQKVKSSTIDPTLGKYGGIYIGAGY